MKLLAFVLPLGLDSFAVAAAIGAAGAVGWRARLRISVIFMIFEAGMPLIGLAAGGGIARVIGARPTTWRPGRSSRSAAGC